MNVNDIFWEIRFVAPNDRNLYRSDNTRVLGVTDLNQRTVYINNKLNGYLLEKVLCHELCHVYAMSYGYEMSIETEEIVADFLSLYGKDILLVADRILGDLYENGFEQNEFRRYS